MRSTPNPGSSPPSPRPRAAKAAGVAATALAAVAIAFGLAGCGLGAGTAPTAVGVVVTTDFGAHTVAANGPLKVAGQETAMSLLMRNYHVVAGDGGGFLESVDGLAGGKQAGAPVDWFYFVNGVEASSGAAATSIHPGDHVWWDRHDWSQTETIPAVVGSFPEPFLNGIDGKRLPVRIECASVGAYACRTVTERLRALGVPAAIAAIGSGGAPESLRVLVAPWLAVEGNLLDGLERGPRASGVFARFSANGKTLTTLDQNGRPVQTLGAGTGLIAATRHEHDAPIWLVTGTDAHGVELAARAFNRATLSNRFAVAVRAGGAVPLPDATAAR
jgi:Domain of unknown function (DUF4430)